MTPRGFKDATTDETQIRAWSRSFPRANIATPTGGRYMVVDVDPRNGGDDALRELTLAYGELPETVLCLTGGGGAHYYFAASENAFPKELVGGIDLKGPGGYVTIRRECLDHMIVLNERCLYQHLKSFLDYYHRSRTHLALEKDSPEPRPIQAADAGRIFAIPQVGGFAPSLRASRGLNRPGPGHSLSLYVVIVVFGCEPILSPQ